ncbi:hypothetical protein AQUCO_02000313v1 [Aquilegia coerulea]|uniref:Uncharacterized protein n=1 Tax=Aquilegia coerulea TaxID=218851 RepID=A0A2G5DGX6_AQUCA|nr:hypothetical protein AQUCO_02000313v1 [Aquilegia coerulea]
MAPNGEPIVTTYCRSNNFSKPPKLSMEGLHRTVSDLSYELSKEAIDAIDAKLPPINEVEDAKCECCGMSEECTPEYIQRVKDKYSDLIGLEGHTQFCTKPKP